MRVLESEIRHMAYDPDFGRVEAALSLVVLPAAGGVRTLRLRTSQPVAGATPLEERLTADAVRLATAMTA